MTHVTRRIFTVLSIAFAIIFSNHSTFGQAPGVAKKMEFDSPLLKRWTGPFGGVPPWNLVRSEEFIGAFDAAIKAADDDITAITGNPETPDFENTIVAMERSGRTLSRLEAMFFVYASNLNVGPIPDIEKVIVPKLSEHEDSIYQDKKLFARISAVYESPAMKDGTFDLAQRRLVDDTYKTFLRKGAKLENSDKSKTLTDEHTTRSAVH